ncbi:MAG: FAD-dependent oxidoreductase [Desulfarculaceae bacterium]|jgi:sarcosine oxidase subunit beta
MGKKEADVVIIGGGIMGCSMAYRLAEKGQKVILLEKTRIGEEASGRNDGGVRQQSRDPAEIPLAMEAIKIWADMKDELEWDVGYRRGGNLRLILNEKEYELYRDWPKREAELGLKSQLLTPEETREIAPTVSKKIRLLGGKYCATDGTANPLVTTKAIARAARRKGVVIKENEPVTGLKIEKDRMVAAITATGEYRGGVFVNAAGPWSRTICNWVGLDFPVTICRAQGMVTEAVPQCVRQFIGFGTGNIRQTLEGQIHFGSNSQPVENFDKRTTMEPFITFGQLPYEIFPFLTKLNVVRSWGGITNWTPDKIPILDKAPNLDNFFLTAGFSGHGFCLGPQVGVLMAEWIADGQSSMDLSAFRWTRFEDIYLSAKATALPGGNK